MKKTLILFAAFVSTPTGKSTSAIAVIAPKGPAQKINPRKSKPQKHHKVPAKNTANQHFIAYSIFPVYGVL